MNLFRDGIALETIDRAWADEILDQVRKQPFVKSQDYGSQEGLAPMITQWDSEQDREVTQALNCPAYFQALWHRIKESRFPWIQNTFGKFTQGSVLINKYPKGHEMRWHSDTLDGTYIQTLLYVTSSEFLEDDGGYLEVGRCSVTEHGVYDRLTPIQPVQTILPNHGVMVNILNTDPTLLHRVAKVQSTKERYTVVLRYGYLENTFTVKKWKTIKGI